MSTDINAVMNRWRNSVKNKQRRIFTFDERIEIKLEEIRKSIYKKRIKLDNWKIREFYYEDIDTYNYIDKDWRNIKIGEQWGGENLSAKFKTKIIIPKELEDENIILRFYIGGDSLLYLNGEAYHGLDPFRNEVLLSEGKKEGEVLHLEVESYVNWHAGEDNKHKLALSELVSIDQEIYDAYWDIMAVFKVLFMDDIDKSLKAFLENNIWNALKDIPVSSDNNKFKEKLLKARNILKKEVYHTDRFKGDGLLDLVGHSHLDIVFMWPHKEYIRKVGRTHSTMLRLMEKYPEFKFSQSQAKIYSDMKKYYPDLFKQVKKRIREGRWEPIGAFWVEPDCNLISGESFVRQILHGQKFWKEEFGIESKTCWQPDVFGLSWALPQILKKSDIEYFLTNKMFVWNDTNRWRKNNFWWEGMDGSRVLSIVPPGHFIGMVDPDHLDQHWRDFSDKKTINESVYCYGWGDGGGGVDHEMIELAERYKDFPGLVKTRMVKAEDAFKSIKNKALNQEIPVWKDELYLEAHRGTYTSKGLLKKLNRQSEFLYRELEIYSTLASMEGKEYPIQQINDQWEKILTNQFHDSLPGTHINEVYHQLLDDYSEIIENGKTFKDESLKFLLEKSLDEGQEEALIVFNSLLHQRRDHLIIDLKELGDLRPIDDNGDEISWQEITTVDNEKKLLIGPLEIPSVGYKLLKLKKIDTNLKEETIDFDKVLENELIRVQFDEEGQLISLFDKEVQRELIPENFKGNKFRLFDDKPGKYDAWDIVDSYRKNEIDITDNCKLEIDEYGPLRKSLILEKSIGDSYLEQKIIIYNNSKRIDFETKIDWVERQKLLKVDFPVNINSTYATYDIAYGNIERSNHRNTSYDEAKFEVPAHLWMDLSQSDYGVSILNDCKYGYECDDNIMKITLLKGSVYPDPEADKGVHKFTYSLYPHNADWRDANIIEKSLDFNNQLVGIKTKVNKNELNKKQSFIKSFDDNITLEAFKVAEDGKGVIIRVVEQKNRTTKSQIEFSKKIRKAFKCNLMEKDEGKLIFDNNRLDINLAPYEIFTARIYFE